MKIKITQEHIDSGKRINGKCCPIALALIDAGFCNVQVCVGRVELGKAVVVLSDSAREFMLRFDAFGSGEPFEFEFDYTKPLGFWGRIKLWFDTPSSWTRYVRGVR